MYYCLIVMEYIFYGFNRSNMESSFYVLSMYGSQMKWWLDNPLGIYHGKMQMEVIDS